MPARTSSTRITKPRPTRIALIKTVLQGYRVRLDEALHPLGITTAQLRLLWAIELNPTASGAEVARLCSVTPQTAQTAVKRMEAQGWIRRHTRAEGGHILNADVTASGRRILLRAKEIADSLDRTLWREISARDLKGMEVALSAAAQKLGFDD